MSTYREPTRAHDIYTDEVDQKGGYVAKIRDKAARAAAEAAQSGLRSYRESNDARVSNLGVRVTAAQTAADNAATAAGNAQAAANNALTAAQAAQQTADGAATAAGNAQTAADNAQTTADDAASAASAAQATADSKVGGWELLWTNASPGSNFNPQTINLDFSDYEEVMVGFRTVKDYDTVAFDFGTLSVYSNQRFTTAYAMGKLAGRIWHVNENKIGIYFDSARFANTYGDRGSNYSYMVPWYIFAR